MKNRSIIFLFLFALVALGIYGLTDISKEEFPTVCIRQGLVVGVYPGASVSEVEEQLTKPLEKTLFSFPEISRAGTKSYSKNGMSYIFVQFPGDFDSDRITETWSKIKLKLNQQKMSLPLGVLAVVVLDDFAESSSLLIAMDSDDKGYRELQGYADELTERLGQIPELARADILGEQTEEIAVMLDMQKLARYHVNPAELMLTYQTSSLQTASGKLEGEFIVSPVHISSTINTEEEVLEKTVYSFPNGNVLKLKDIATIERRFKPDASSVTFNDNAALVINVTMRSGNDIVKFGKKVDRILTEFQQDLPQSVNMTRIADLPAVVGKSVLSFLRDLVISMLIVIFVMMMLFPMRSALIASSGVPICTAVAIAVMYLTGIHLNTVSLAALIVVLGMIVDDSIVTMDGYMDKIARGMDRFDAAMASTKELLLPMLMATVAICAMFFPTLMIFSGIMRDFIAVFPLVITIALGSSLAYAVLIVPSLETRYIQSAEQKETAITRMQARFFNAIQKVYDKGEEFCFRHPGFTMFMGVAVVAGGVLFFLLLNIQMMPKADRDSFAMEVYLDSSSTLDETGTVSDSIQKMLRDIPGVKSVTSFRGTNAPRFHMTYAPALPGPNVAQMIVRTGSAEDTKKVLPVVQEKFEFWFPEAKIHFKQLDYQAVQPIEVYFFGADLLTMKEYADRLQLFMHENLSDRLSWVHSDCDDFVPVIDVSMDPYESTRLGVSKIGMGASLTGSLNSVNIASVWEDGHRIPVSIYNDIAYADVTYEEVADHMISTSNPAVTVPLRQVASISPEWEPSQLTHLGGRPVLTVTSDLKYGCSQPAAMKEIRKFIEMELEPDMPEGMSVSYGGLTAVNAQMIPEIKLCFIAAVIILFVFLLITFKKISLSVLTMALSSLCLLGTTFGLWLFGLDFSMTAVLGLISLVGIVVRNGIMMFEYAESLRSEQGMSVRDAAFQAGQRRMRPIFLTSCTTALGVLPMILSGDLLWMPMGVTICFGTMISLVFIVLIMPVSYWMLYRKEDMK